MTTSKNGNAARSGVWGGKNRRMGLRLNMLSEDDLEDIHLATLEILENTGISVENAEARSILRSGGASVDETANVARIPAYLVEEATASAPSRVILYGRDPRWDLVLDTQRVHFTNFSEGVLIVDPYNGELRAPLKADLEKAARLIDALEDVDFCEKAIGAHDVNQKSAPLHNAEAYLPNTVKHCAFGPGDDYMMQRMIEMGEALCGSPEAFARRPIISFTTCPVSPLRLVDETCRIIMAAARRNVACNILSMAMAGATAPVTLAGALTVHNAEVLGGVVLSQLTRKGAPVIYGSSTTAMDLRRGTASVGTPEAALLSGAAACVAKYYKIPSYVGGA